MKNRNMLIFVVLSILLLGGYNMLMTRLNPPKPAVEQVQGPEPAQPATSAASPAAGAASAAPGAPVALPAVDPRACVSLRNDTLNLTWRKGDGALVQVEWNDGTKFFPEAKLGKDGVEISKDFPGLAGAVDVRFDGEPDVAAGPQGRTVSFHSAQGDRLTYQVPDRGYVVSMEWASPRAASLNLLPEPGNPLAVAGLGRLFSIEPNSIKAVTWASMLKDPFFSFLGSKRKVLPPASRRLGMDAGLDPKKPAQTTHYFAAIWDASREPQRITEGTAGYLLAPEGSGKVSARLYLGPKQTEALAQFHTPGNPEEGTMFKQVVDFGFFGLVAKLLFMILKGIHAFVPNWGWAIILLTVVIRGALWPLNNKTTVQMIRMKELEPHQKALQAKYEKFGNDMAKKAEMQKELMAFYKKNGHNPMGGCLPMLLQMPVFFALWSMLNAVFELRHAPFLGWLTDLSAQDPFYILPVLMGVSMIIQQAMTPAVGDPAQRKMMMVLMPVMFSFFFAKTPSGLCLYYLMFNIIGILQTWLVMKTYKPQPVVA
jgi:YidC/Oxa1 family membrane protein insertase